MTAQDLLTLPLGTKVYRVHNANITAFTILGLHPKYPEKYLYLISHYSVTDAHGIYIPSDNYFYTDNYDQAKEIMWNQTIDNLYSTNNIYFKGAKNTNL